MPSFGSSSIGSVPFVADIVHLLDSLGGCSSSTRLRKVAAAAARTTPRSSRSSASRTTTARVVGMHRRRGLDNSPSCCSARSNSLHGSRRELVVSPSLGASETECRHRDSARCRLGDAGRDGQQPSACEPHGAALQVARQIDKRPVQSSRRDQTHLPYTLCGVAVTRLSPRGLRCRIPQQVMALVTRAFIGGCCARVTSSTITSSGHARRKSSRRRCRLDEAGLIRSRRGTR